MKRPDFVTNQDLERWSNKIQEDEEITPELTSQPIIMELMFAGLWLCEELEKEGCPEEFISRIQNTAGQISFGRDIWQVHLDMLDKYKTSQLDYEIDLSELN